jgi:hypothetical protein
MQNLLNYYGMDRFTPLCFMKSSRTARIDITRRVQNLGSVWGERSVQLKRGARTLRKLHGIISYFLSKLLYLFGAKGKKTSGKD